MILVIDSNIIVSAYTVSGRTREYWFNSLGIHRLIISPEIFMEIERILRHIKFGLKSAEIRRILADVIDRCEIVRPKERFQGYIADEQDRHLANLIRAVGADRIVTGDHALQEMRKIGSTPVVSLAEFATQDC